MEIPFNTAREFPGTNLFQGPKFDKIGNVISRGRYLDKIDKLLVAVTGEEGVSTEDQLRGDLTYGGTSYIRNQVVGSLIRIGRIGVEQNEV